MAKFIERVNEFIEKVGKRNFILLTFIIIVLVISGLYGTFSLFTTSDVSYSDNIKIYKFIIFSYIYRVFLYFHEGYYNSFPESPQCNLCRCPSRFIPLNPFWRSASYSTIATELPRFSDRISPSID